MEDDADVAALRAALVAAGGVIDTSRGEVRGAPDPYVHEHTGMRFPRWIGPFQRRVVNRFDSAGTDIGVSYERREGGAKTAHVSVFLCPVPPPLAAISPTSQLAGAAMLFERIKADALDGLTDAVVEEEAPLDRPHIGHRARIASTALFDQTEQPVREGLWLHAYLARDWVLTVRASWPAALDDAGEDCATLVDALEWPRSFRA